MNTEGQVGVELRLVMDQLRKDVKQAAEMLKTSLGTGAEGAASGTEKATRKMSDLEQQTRKTAGAMKDLKRSMDDAWRQQGPPKIIDASMPTSKGLFGGPGQVFTNLGERSGANAIAQWQAQMRAYHSAGGPRAGRAAGVGALGLPPGFTSIGAPPSGIFSSGGAGGGGGAALGAGGLFGGGGMLPILAQVGAALAGLRVAIGLVKYAFDMLLSPLRAMVAVAERARQAYAGAQTSGQPLGYSIGAGMLGSAFGVAKEDIMLFGESVRIMSERMKYSIKVFQETNQPLTMLGWNMQALKASMASVFASITAQMAPAMNQAVNLFKNLADSLARSTLVQGLTGLLKILMHVGNVIMGVVGVVAQSFDLLLQTIVDSLQYFIRQVKNTIARWTGGKVDDTDTFAETKDKFDIIRRTLTELFSRQVNNQTAPGPAGSANRMAASAWERMGLIVGPGPAADAGRETARNTRRMVWLLEQIVGASGGGAPRGGYGSNPLTSAA